MLLPTYPSSQFKRKVERPIGKGLGSYHAKAVALKELRGHSLLFLSRRSALCCSFLPHGPRNSFLVCVFVPPGTSIYVKDCRRLTLRKGLKVTLDNRLMLSFLTHEP